MKTTVEIADSLLAQARQLAAERSITLRSVIEEGLRKVIEDKPKAPFKLRDGSFGGKGMRREMTWEEIRDEIYKGRGGVIAIDTNILVYSHRPDSKFFVPAGQAVNGLAEGREDWAIPWPCVHEFLGVVTNRRIFLVPTPTEIAIAQVEIWMESPSLRLIGEAPTYWRNLAEILIDGKITGPRVHDARIAAICQTHGVRELWSADRDFSRMRGLKTKNPLLPAK